MMFRAMFSTSTSLVFFFSSRRRHTRFDCDWSSDVCSSDLGAKPAKPKDAMDPIHYKVKPGDSLWALARRFGVKLKEVLVMNGITDARRLRPGQELLLPPAGSAGLPQRVASAR